MDFIEEAKKLGFSDAAVMKTDKLVFVPEYRVFCEENACGNYDKNPACPPESGTVEEMKERALDYENTLVPLTEQHPSRSFSLASETALFSFRFSILIFLFNPIFYPLYVSLHAYALM